MRSATGGEGAPFNAGRLIGQQTAVAIPGDSFNDTTAETTFESSQIAFPGYLFNTVGSMMQVRSRGTYGTGSSAPTLRTRLYFDATAVADTGAQSQSPNVSDQGWQVDVDIVCAMTGAGGSLEAQGYRRASTGARSSQIEDMENTATIPFDTSQPFTIKLTEQFNASGTSNGAAMRQFYCTMWSPT